MVPVKLNLRVRQQYPGQETDMIRQSMDGTMGKTVAGWVLTYDEPGEGMHGVRTEITMEPGAVTVRRNGGISSVMEFAEGRRTVFSYGIDLGTMDMGIETEKLNWSFNGRQGALNMRYCILLPDGSKGIMDYHLLMK